MFEFFSGFGVLFFFAFVVVARSIRQIDQYERGVRFTLGKCNNDIVNPGITLVIPMVQRLVRVDMRNIVVEVPSQDVITRDNITLKVNAVVNIRVVDPYKAVMQVENYLYAISQLSQTTLRDVLGRSEMDEVLSQRDAINVKLADILDNVTETWGVKVVEVALKNVDLPAEMQRAMAAQAEAERSKRAKIIAAEGEFQASQKLAEASQIMSENPMSLQLRYLQTLTEISAEKNSTMIFPFPLEILRFFDSLTKK